MRRWRRRISRQNSVVTRLLQAQFPEWADIPIRPVEHIGWDNVTYRLGDEMSVRLPSADEYGAQVEKEHRWLPTLAEHLPLPIPQPLARGAPGCGYPWPWSVYRWLPGRHATVGRIADLNEFAHALAQFLTELYRITPADGPPPGAHNFFRGGSLTRLARQTESTIELLSDEIDAALTTRVWKAALASEWSGDGVWFHGDMSASNLLVVDGALDAVIDFGCSGVGDPACDLAIAWTFFFGDNREVLRDELPLDADTWARGRGWALWKALITHAEVRESNPADVEVAGLGFAWRQHARDVIDDVTADFVARG